MRPADSTGAAQVFYLFGGTGLLWSWWWESVMKGVARQDPALVRKLEVSFDTIDEPAGKAKQGVPWRAFLRCRPVQALAYVHFCNNWCASPYELPGGHLSRVESWRRLIGATSCRAAYTMSSWLPSYFSDSLSLDLTQAAQAALFPPIAAIIASAIAGPTADYVVSQGAPVALVRKSAQVGTEPWHRSCWQGGGH